MFSILRYYFVFSAKLDGVKTYMRMRRVPNHLQVKVIKWFDYLWLTQKCSDEERAVSCLPDKLKVNNPPKNVADGYPPFPLLRLSPLSFVATPNNTNCPFLYHVIVFASAFAFTFCP